MKQDLRLAFRLMLRQPLMAATAVVSLTVGIALTNVGFATMEALLFSRLPFDNGDRFVRLRVVSAKDRVSATLTPESTVQLLSGVKGLEHLGAATSRFESAVLPSGQPVELTVSAITPSSLAYLPAVPVRGRPLQTDDAAPNAAPAVVISESFWRRTLEATDAVVGATLVVGTTPRTIVGVMPAAFEFPNSPDIWVPLDERWRAGAPTLPIDARLFGVLAPGHTLESVITQVAGVLPSLKSNSSGTPLEVDVQVSAFTDLGDMAGPLSVAIVLAVLAVLSVIAANVGNLVLVRSFSRAREFAMRAALGASRGRLVTQVVVEVLMLGVVSALLGSLAGRAILRQLNAIPDLPFWMDFTGSSLTAVLVAGATILATAVAGARPAFKATRQDVLGDLRSGGRTNDVAFGRAAGLVVITQIAMSVVMLHGALVVAQAVRAYANPPIDLPPNILTLGIGINIPQPSTANPRSPRVTAAEIERHAAAMPGALATGLSTALPRHSPDARHIEVESRFETSRQATHRTPSASVSPGFFEVLAAKALEGRTFTASDTLPGAPPVAIVNAPFVRDVLGNGPALGHRFRVVEGGQPGPWFQVIGVVPDLGLSLGDPTLAAGFYVPLKSDEGVVFLAMRTAAEPMTYAEPLRRWLRERDPGLTMFTPERLEDVAMDDRAFFANFSSALSAVGAVTLALALVGVYSMMSLVITRRTREIGIRVALGATPSLIIQSVASRAAVQVLGGGLIGAVIALLSLKGRSILVSRLSDGGPWTLPIVIALLVAAGLAATWVPLRRALSIRPQEALKAE